MAPRLRKKCLFIFKSNKLALHGNLVSAIFISIEIMTQNSLHVFLGHNLDATPTKVFLNFFLEDKTSVPDVFSSCSFIPRAHFETSLVMVGCYGYEL